MAKMENLNGDFTWKTSFRFLFSLYERLIWKQNNWICDMSKRGFLTEIFCRYNTKHTEIISGALFSFTTHKL